MPAERFREHLSRQLQYVRRSAIAFDEGHVAEGARIATNLRILFHDTRSQTSLLSHLGARSTEVLSTCQRRDFSQGLPLVFEGLLGFRRGVLGPKLQFSSTNEFLPADDWWLQVVLVNKSSAFTRKDLVLHAADKDGGAHVDKALSPEYEALTKGAWMQVTGDEPPRAVVEHQFLMIRQMAFELLESPQVLSLSGAKTGA